MDEIYSEWVSISCYLMWVSHIMARRFAKWKRDAQNGFIQDTLRYERLLSKVADDLVRARSAGPAMNQVIDTDVRRKALTGRVSVLP